MTRDLNDVIREDGFDAARHICDSAIKYELPEDDEADLKEEIAPSSR